MGKKINLTLDDVDVRKALELLGREGPLNILASPSVAGRVTVNLKDVPLDAALDAVLKSAGLVARREKDIIYIDTLEEAQRLADEKLPIRVYHLNSLKSTDLEKMLKPFLSPKGKLTASPPSAAGLPSATGGAGGGAAPGGGGAPPGGGAPSAGAASTGAGTAGNALAGEDVIIVQDREPNLLAIDRVVAQLDIQPPQVLIEAVILTLELDKDVEFGVNFALADQAGKILSVFGNGALINSAVGFTPARTLNPTPGDPNASSFPIGTVRGNPAQGFAANEQGVRFGFTSKTVTGFLRALEKLGKIEVLATPRLLVLNKQLAQLQLGQLLGYSTFSQSIVSTVQQVQFLPVGTQLRVRPFVSSDGMIRMEIHPERSTGTVVNNIPQTTTSEVTTNVLVPDGSTMLIGGLIDRVRDRSQNSVPWLGSLPGVGALFRERLDTTTHQELVVLLTVHLWNPYGGRGPNCFPPGQTPSGYLPQGLGLAPLSQLPPPAQGILPAPRLMMPRAVTP
jgi:type II secretory pathway component GspD/PulD (secretin)